jgi:hypothetical protein
MHIIKRTAKESKQAKKETNRLRSSKLSAYRPELWYLWYCIKRFGLQLRSFFRLREVETSQRRKERIGSKSLLDILQKHFYISFHVLAFKFQNTHFKTSVCQ